jgi:hypothetical protein
MLRWRSCELRKRGAEQLPETGNCVDERIKLRGGRIGGGCGSERSNGWVRLGWRRHQSRRCGCAARENIAHRLVYIGEGVWIVWMMVNELDLKALVDSGLQLS